MGSTKQVVSRAGLQDIVMLGRSLLTLALLATASAQFLTRCSNYQTAREFTDDYIEKMRATPGGFIVRLTNGAQDQCQRLQFVDGNDFNLTFIDSSQSVQHYTDRYKVATSTLNAPAKLHLTLVPRLIGADLGGNLVLHPLIVRDDMVAFVSCFQQGLGIYMTEQVLVFTPYEDKNQTTVEDMKVILKTAGVPRVTELVDVSIECTPDQNATQSSPFNINTILGNLGLPFSRVSDAINRPEGQNGESNGVFGGVSQTLSFLRGEYFPANLYATSGSIHTAEQEIPTSVAAAESLSAFHKASNSSENTVGSEEEVVVEEEEPVTEATQ